MEQQTRQEIDYNVSDTTVEEAITQEVYLQPSQRTVICLLITAVGVECVGSSSVISSTIPLIDAKKLAREAAKMKVKESLVNIHQLQFFLQEQEVAKQGAEAEAEAEAAAQTPAVAEVLEPTETV